MQKGFNELLTIGVLDDAVVENLLAESSVLLLLTT